MEKEKFLKILSRSDFNNDKDDFVKFLNKLDKIKYKDKFFFELTEEEVLSIFNLETSATDLFCSLFFKNPYCYTDERNNKLIKEMDSILFKRNIRDIKSLDYTRRVEEGSVFFVSCYSVENDKKEMMNKFCKNRKLNINDFIKNVNTMDDVQKIESLFGGFDIYKNLQDLNIVNFKEVFDLISFDSIIEKTELFENYLVKILNTESNKKEELLEIIFSKIEDKENFYFLCVDLLKKKADWNKEYINKGFYDESEKEKEIRGISEKLNNCIRFLEKFHLKTEVNKMDLNNEVIIKKRL